MEGRVKCGVVQMIMRMSLVLWMRVWVLLAASHVVDVAMGVANMKSSLDASISAAGMVLPGADVRVEGVDEVSSFKVAIFADLHYGENAWEAWGPRQDVNSTAVQSFLLDLQKPGGLGFHVGFHL